MFPAQVEQGREAKLADVSLPESRLFLENTGQVNFPSYETFYS